MSQPHKSIHFSFYPPISLVEHQVDLLQWCDCDISVNGTLLGPRDNARWVSMLTKVVAAQLKNLMLSQEEP